MSVDGEESTKEFILAELQSSNPNVLQIREMVKEHPRVLADSSSLLRVEVWVLFLLGPGKGGGGSGAFGVENIPPAEDECRENNVLHADVIRTRGYDFIFTTQN